MTAKSKVLSSSVETMERRIMYQLPVQQITANMVMLMTMTLLIITSFPKAAMLIVPFMVNVLKSSGRLRCQGSAR